MAFSPEAGDGMIAVPAWVIAGLALLAVGIGIWFYSRKRDDTP